MTNSHVNANFSKRLRIFKNGDDSFGGKQIVISQRATKSWDAFLAQVTNQLDSNVAVRSIHTPVNGTAITSMDQLSDKLDYVAVTTGTFRKLK
ncbi:hypothetical protein HELRODRAFT_66174 [Helobdella robusta]|uniref:Doublecortin domain-containing protein n=1 Tax=Helobdella robusta TaxID=6412 RepID=T1FYI0_HELRO|nr:hypothetical protein HELRODRAFT_66174 [Helobdella robusta]ESO02140.1 hypothetical protein HELRODRAFT_66174 [Helobdella robusta]